MTSGPTATVMDTPCVAVRPNESVPARRTSTGEPWRGCLTVRLPRTGSGIVTSEDFAEAGLVPARLTAATVKAWGRVKPPSA